MRKEVKISLGFTLLLFVLVIVIVGYESASQKSGGSSSGATAASSNTPFTPAQQLKADGYSVTSQGPLNGTFGCTKFALSDPQNSGYGQAVYKCREMQEAELNLQRVVKNGFIIVTGQLPEGY